MKRNSFLILLLFPFFSYSQYFELGLMGGLSVYQGDLAPSSFKGSFGESHPAFGLMAKYNFNKFLGLRGGILSGKISGDDANADSENRRMRNLSFESSIFEASLLLEINVFGYVPEGRERVFSPYVFGGVANLNYNPKAELNGELHELQPLGTEGQGMPQFPEKEKYKLNRLIVPVGAGLRVALGENWSLAIEMGMRRTFTDYLDDVSGTYVEYSELLEGNGELAAALGNRSGEYLGTGPVSVPTGSQRGDAEDDDWYLAGGLMISYHFTGGGYGNRGGRGRRGRMGCPTF